MPVSRYFIPPSGLSRRDRSKATRAYEGIVASSIATKMPKRSRIETRSIAPTPTERIRVRYSGASPVPPAQRAAARIVKNADRATISLKYNAKSSTTYPLLATSYRGQNEVHGRTLNVCEQARKDAQDHEHRGERHRSRHLHRPR